MNDEKKREIMKTKEFNLFWSGFQMGRDMDILNDDNLPEIEFALKEYEFKYQLKKIKKVSKLKSKKKQKLRDAINQYCKIYADYIFINEKIEGKLHQISISKLSEEKRAEFISICINKKVFPIRVKTPEELGFKDNSFWLKRE